MICLFTHPICENNRFTARQICRRSCYHVQNKACSNLFNYKYPSTYFNSKSSENENKNTKDPKSKI